MFASLAAIPDQSAPHRATLSKNLPRSRQIHEFLTQVAILRCYFESRVTKYYKLLPSMDCDGPSGTGGPYGGEDGGQTAGLT